MAKKWAEIVGRVVRVIHNIDDETFVPVMSPAIGRFLDVTNIQDVTEGWLADGDTVTEPPESDEQTVWIKVTFSKNEIIKNGTDSTTITMQAYMDSALTVTPTLPRSVRLKLKVRALRYGDDRDIVLDQVKPLFNTSGQAQFNFTAQNNTPCCKLYLLESDLEPLTMPNGKTFVFKMVPATGDLIYLDVVREV